MRESGGLRKAKGLENKRTSGFVSRFGAACYRSTELDFKHWAASHSKGSGTSSLAYSISVQLKTACEAFHNGCHQGASLALIQRELHHLGNQLLGEALSASNMPNVLLCSIPKVLDSVMSLHEAVLKSWRKGCST